MFAEHLHTIKQDLSKHHRDRSQLCKLYVQQRLNKSLYSYYSDLSTSANYLQNRKLESVIRKM